MLRILTYHRVADVADAPHLHPGLISASPQNFGEQMRWLAGNFDVLSLAELLAIADGRTRLPRRAALVTFDDAYADFAQHAWPALKSCGVPATLFVPTAFPDQPQRRFWWDRLHSALQHVDAAALRLHDADFSFRGPQERAVALKRLQAFIKTLPHGDAMAAVDRVCAQLGEHAADGNGVLGWNALRHLAAEGVTLAAHGRTHALLDRLTPDEARAEIAGAQRDLRSHIGHAPPVFCYPGGAHNADTLRILAEEGFRLGFSTLDGHNRNLDDPLRLRRTNITPRTTLPILRARLTAVGGYLDRWRHRAPALPPMRSGNDTRIAYIMSRFPKLTETFILWEILEQQRQGLAVEIFPLLREKAQVAHPEVAALTARARFYPFVSLGIIRDNLHFLRTAPGRYLRAWVEVLRGTFGSANFFFGALGIFPKCASFARAMQRDRITHVHAHFASHPALAALIVHRLTGLPFSFTAHGSDLHVDRRMLPEKVRAARFAVAISEFNRQIMIATCGSEAAAKIHVVHCGIDPQQFTPAPPVPASGPLRVVSVGSLEEVKGHEFLVRACARLAAAGRDFTCRIFGEGPQRAALLRLIHDLGLQERVSLAGGRPRPEIIAALQAADVMVLASVPTARGKREGIPVSLMEAMACALPVVSSRLSGIPELVEDGVTGFLCAPRDVDSLASALEALAREPKLRRRMGVAGRERVVRDFHLARSTARLAMLFTGNRTVADKQQAPVSALPVTAHSG